MNNYFKKISSGFTILEAVITISIIIIIGAAVVISFGNSSKVQILAGAEGDVISLLNTARENTISSLNSTNYSVHFQSDKAVMFIGSTYTANLSTNVTVTFDSSVTMSSISLTGAGSNVTFDRITGTTAEDGTLTLISGGNNSISKTITIIKTGLVSGS